MNPELVVRFQPHFFRLNVMFLINIIKIGPRTIILIINDDALGAFYQINDNPDQNKISAPWSILSTITNYPTLV